MYPRHRHINLVNLALTSRCNRRCPECSYGMHILHEAWDISWDELVFAARTLGNVGRINLTGGEPTMHPCFAEWSPKFKQLFAENQVSIETNGFGFKRFPEAFLHLDMIAPTLYRNGPSGPSNEEDIRFLEKYRDENKPELPIQSYEPVHVPRTLRREGRDCFRAGSGAIALFNNHLYPCCTGQGIEGAASIALTTNWREEIMRCTLACQNCFFAEERLPWFRSIWRSFRR